MDEQHKLTPEQPIIRPPSEWRSTLIRVTRGCNWNRCRFCGLYPYLGEPVFSERTFEEIADDIRFLHQRRPDAEEFFLGDADPLTVGPELIGRILALIHELFTVKRITSYARTSTLKKIGAPALAELGSQGLSRVHLGLESGNAAILRFQRKGQSPEMVEVVSNWLKAASIEQSYYVLLGLGGADHWREHIVDTAAVINRTQPEFVRLRRLWLYGGDGSENHPGCPLMRQVEDHSFVPQTPDGTVQELALLLENLKPAAIYLTCDHANNYIQVQGRLDKDLAEMKQTVSSFLALPESQRKAYYASHDSRI